MVECGVAYGRAGGPVGAALQSDVGVEWVAEWAVKLLCWEGKCIIGLLAGSLVGG